MPGSSKAIGAAVALFAMAAGLAACGGAAPSASRPSATSAVPTTSTTAPSPTTVPKALSSLSSPSGVSLRQWVWAYQDLDYSQRGQFEALAPSYQEAYLYAASKVSWNPKGPVSATQASELSTILTKEVHAYRRVLEGRSSPSPTPAS